jgi:gamma-glutamyltranspeptidase/glutathione hydrolase
MNRGTRTLVIALLSIALCVSAAHAAARSPAFGTRGMVVASESEAARAGRAMFERGGNAVDAAIATAFALAVTQPFSAGLGGGAFILIRTGLGEVHAIDARETAPAAATRDMFRQPGVPERASLVGPLAVGTPGFVAGCALALERWGTLPLSDVLKPAIALAEQGFAIGRYHARMIEAMRARGVAQRFPATARIQFPPEGTPARPGWRLVQPELAATLRRISAEGARAMYRGPLADALVAAVQSRGGILTAEDLASYQTMIRDPVIGYYRGHRIYTFPPPSSGGVAMIEALNVLEGFDLASLGAGSSASVHKIAEALKLSFADTLAYVGDPDFVSVPVSRLTEKPYAAQLRARFAPTAWWQRAPSRWFEGDRPIRVEGPGLPARDAGTTHLSASDASGNAVALTMTINTPYGSGITADRTGVLLNNEMDDFATAADLPNTYGLVDTRGANAIAPRKRPRSSMTPTIVERNGGGLFMVTGSPGGPRIISTTLLSIVNVIDYGMDVSQAVSAPRFHHQWSPDVLYLEPATARDVAHALRERGHVVEVEQSDWSAAEAIVRDPDGAFWGGSDPRRDGLAAGY